MNFKISRGGLSVKRDQMEEGSKETYCRGEKKYEIPLTWEKSPPKGNLKSIFGKNNTYEEKVITVSPRQSRPKEKGKSPFIIAPASNRPILPLRGKKDKVEMIRNLKRSGGGGC